MLAFTSLPSSHPSFYHQPTTQSRSISHLLTNRPSKQTKLSSTNTNTNKPVDTKSGAAYHASINQQIVQKRNTISRLKKEAKQKVIDNDRRRNLRLRTLFLEENQNSTAQDGAESNGSGKGDRAPPPMFAVKVVTCPTLRTELKMNGREKRGRMFVERSPSLLSTLEEGKQEYACTSLKTLRRTIHEFFRRLKKSTYILSASLPTFDVDGNVLTHSYDSDDEQHDNMGTWTLETDVNVQNAFIQAETFYNESSTNMKRPTLILHVTKDPNAPKPPPLPTYLQNMSNPQNSTTITMLSFYSFPPQGISDPEDTALQLKRLWKPFKVLGRVYVANEGINAQMAIPSNILSNFLNCCTLSIDNGGSILSEVLGIYMENGINIDSIPITIQDFEKEKPFKRLHIRVRSQIVADGLEDPLDWQNAGYDMPPVEWHEKLKLARESSTSSISSGDSKSGISNDLPIVLDCRNSYETQVGKFELAEPLNTTNFRDSWSVLQERLKDVPKDAPIMTYCTGGIRCVKVASYLTQEMGYTNVSRLAGGVVAYDRTINEQVPNDEPMFKGVNYVFDGRMGRRITNDQLGNCYTCGRKTHLVSNCNNDNCHKRMVQCEYCSETFFGTCSEGCKTRVVNSGMIPKRRSSSGVAAEDEEVKEDSTSKDDKKEQVYTNLDDYSSAHSTSPQPLLTQIESNTHKFLPTGAHMVSGQMQGSLLTTLASQSREGRILEIGTFTGYATACFLEGAAAAGRCLNTDTIGTREGGGPFVLSLERDRRALGLASAHLQVMTDHGIGNKGAQEASKLYNQDSVPDFEGDSLSFIYNDIAGCELLRVNDALATVEELAMHNPTNAAYDIVFVDADKTRLYEYVNALVSNDRVLKKGGLILVDNVLWKGLVLDASIGYDSDDETMEVETSQDKELLKKNRRARKLANKMHRFNSEVVKDDRVDVLLMNLRDGLSMIRKR